MRLAYGNAGREMMTLVRSDSCALGMKPGIALRAHSVRVPGTHVDGGPISAIEEIHNVRLSIASPERLPPEEKPLVRHDVIGRDEKPLALTDEACIPSPVAVLRLHAVAFLRLDGTRGFKGLLGLPYRGAPGHFRDKPVTFVVATEEFARIRRTFLRGGVGQKE